MRTFEVFSRQGCHLCEILLGELAPLLRGRATLVVVDIDRHAGLREKYGARIPVVELEGRLLCQYHLDRQAIEQALQPGARNGLPS